MTLERTRWPSFDECLYSGVTPTGLRFYCLPRKYYSKKHAVLAVDYGAADLEFVSARRGLPVTVPAGSAHFLEHKMFQQRDGSALDRFSAMGAQANAYTGHSLTSYLFSTTDEFDSALSLLLRLVAGVHLTHQTVEKEKSIIEHELRMYHDIPAVRVERNLMKALYHANPVREDIGGTLESVRRITLEALLDSYETFYVPQNMALFVTGGVDPDRSFETAVACAEGQDRALSRPRGRPVKIEGPREPDGVRTQRVEERMASSMPVALVGFKDSVTGLAGDALASRQCAGDLALLALFGRSSPAFEEFYESGLITDRFSLFFDTEHGYSHAVLGGETPDPERLAERARAIVAGARKNGLGVETVNRLKRKAMGEFAALFNSPERLARMFCSLVFKGVSLDEYFQLLRRVSQDEVEQVLTTCLSPERQAISIIWPEEMHD